MQLSNLKSTWSELNRGGKLSIIERSQKNRIKAYEKAVKKKSKSKKKKKRKKKSKNVKKTPEQLIEMKKKMGKEEWENFKMMVGMDDG